MRSPHVFATDLPTGTLPVKAITFVSGCSTKDFPTFPPPVRTWKTPFGNSEKASANINVTRVVYSEGFIITALPAARAAPASQARSTNG